MKYKTFRALAITGAVALSGLWMWQCTRMQKANHDAFMARTRAAEAEWAQQQVVAQGDLLPDPPGLNFASASAPLPPPSVGPVGGVTELAGSVGGQTPEAYLLVTLGGPASEEKLKDVTGGQGSKINVYNEGGKWARAKVDHDRDEKWDEKWSLDGGIVLRQISPNDDEVYSRELRRLGAAWVESGAGGPAPEITTAGEVTVAASSGRPVDDAVLRALQSPAQEKIKDATGGTPFKVNLYSDDRARWNRVKIDLDRDEKWDEKWTIAADGSIEREVAPADDEVYSEKYQRSGDAWVRR
jgi:hypothetical protein